MATYQIKFTSTGGIAADGTITGSAVYNAVWNDLADCLIVPEDTVLEPGYCYCFDGEKYYKATKYLDDGIMGIHSDTYGFAMGKDPEEAPVINKKIHLAVAGYVLAYVDQEYPVGTPLTCTDGGRLTEIKLEDKIIYPEKIVALYWKPEFNETWGTEERTIQVNGRHWVKVK